MSPHSDSGPAHAHGHERGHGRGRAAAETSGHGHGHHPTDVDWDVMATQLESGAALQLPGLRRAAAHLSELLGPRAEAGRILDIGSGPGVMTCVLAEAFAGAETVAVDATPGLLDRARARAEKLGLGDRVAVRHAELPEGLYGGDGPGGEGLGTADLIWSSKLVHHLGDQQGALDALARALRPGGVLAVAEGGLPVRFLPRDIGIGRPGLQARLDALHEHWFSIMRAELPGSTPVVEDWPAMLGRAGLSRVGSFTYLLDLPAPLGETARTFLHTQLTRLRESAGDMLDADDLDTLDVLLDPEARRGILHRPDAFLLSATTVFTGVRGASGG
ncbi:class I SAM-dependent methyltransferase [Streptomyces sp. NPDC085665]|uniref:class I SAM-dependent methyltransferase n=1 Tax=Streptomyces sp. NPDC085665 TaxID=3365735 RepID=UPI0037D23713